MQRTCVGWPARSVRSLRYHGTVLCLADSAPNFTANRSLVAPPPSGICYFTPNICSSLPWAAIALPGPPGMSNGTFLRTEQDEDVLVSQGQPMADAIRQIGVSEVTYYRWRQEFGGLKTEQVKRLKDLELENSRLRKAVSDLTLNKLILQEAARGNF